MKQKTDKYKIQIVNRAEKKKKTLKIIGVRRGNVMLGKRKMLIKYMVIWRGWGEGLENLILTIILIYLDFIILDRMDSF